MKVIYRHAISLDSLDTSNGYVWLGIFASDSSQSKGLVSFVVLDHLVWVMLVNDAVTADKKSNAFAFIDWAWGLGLESRKDGDLVVFFIKEILNDTFLCLSSIAFVTLENLIRHVVFNDGRDGTFICIEHHPEVQLLILVI